VWVRVNVHGLGHGCVRRRGGQERGVGAAVRCCGARGHSYCWLPDRACVRHPARGIDVKAPHDLARQVHTPRLSGTHRRDDLLQRVGDNRRGRSVAGHAARRRGERAVQLLLPLGRRGAAGCWVVGFGGAEVGRGHCCCRQRCAAESSGGWICLRSRASCSSFGLLPHISGFLRPFWAHRNLQQPPRWPLVAAGSHKGWFLCKAPNHGWLLKRLNDQAIVIIDAQHCFRGAAHG